ncbi:MAG: InlB B-repeat-containing protein, partial [Kiritimatiellae bacterium]|nr:InlB B-repeat-containing protein [Kiritimatiellia bacterium]
GTTPLTAAQRIEYGNPAVAPSAPQHVGLTFTGWEPSDFGSVVSNMSIVAQYETNSYTVVYDPNGGTGSMTNDVFMYFMEYSLQSNEFVRPVHEFVGWSTDPNAATNEVEYADGVVVSNLTAVAGGTNVLYAVWHSLVSEYSIAADCTNLVLECAREDRKWSIDLDSGFASATSVVADGRRICDMTTLIEGTGTLMFRVKILTASADNKEFNFYVVGDGYTNTVPEITALYYNKELDGDWILCVFSKTEPSQQKFMWQFVGNTYEDRVYVDQVRWYPNRLVSVDTSGSSWIASGHEVNGITESVLSHWDEILPSGITEAQIDATKSDGTETSNSSVTNALAILNLGYAPEYTVNGATAKLTFVDAPVLSVSAFEVEDSTDALLGASVTNTLWGLPDWSDGIDQTLGVWGAPTLTSDWTRVEAGCDLSRYVSEGVALFDFDVGTNRFFKVKAE